MPETLVQRRIEDHVEAARTLLEREVVAEIADIAAVVADAATRGATVLLFGNGGSAADAQHLAGELLGRFRRERQALAAIALADNVAAVTAIANDYEYADVFARQIAGLGRAGDVAIGLSTSGESANVVRGLEAANANGLSTVGFTGRAGGAVGAAAQRCFCAPATDTERVQELHMLVGHIVCELVELELDARPLAEAGTRDPDG